MAQFLPSCNKCLRRIDNGQGSVLSCGHFCCDSCSYQPDKCPACNEVCSAESLLTPGPEVIDYLIPPAQAIKQVLEVLNFQDDHHQTIRRRFEEEASRHGKKLAELNRVLVAARSENQALKSQLSVLENELVQLRHRSGVASGLPPLSDLATPSGSAHGSSGSGSSSSFFSQSFSHQSTPSGSSRLGGSSSSGGSWGSTPRQQHSSSSRSVHSSGGPPTPQQFERSHSHEPPSAPTPPTPQAQQQLRDLRGRGHPLPSPRHDASGAQYQLRTPGSSGTMPPGTPRGSSVRTEPPSPLQARAIPHQALLLQGMTPRHGRGAGSNFDVMWVTTSNFFFTLCVFVFSL